MSSFKVEKLAEFVAAKSLSLTTLPCVKSNNEYNLTKFYFEKPHKKAQHEANK